MPLDLPYLSLQIRQRSRVNTSQPTTTLGTLSTPGAKMTSVTNWLQSQYSAECA